MNIEISGGFYPGILLGVRNYREETHSTAVFYIPFFCVAVSVYNNEDED
jgi:hypothetical protein